MATIDISTEDKSWLPFNGTPFSFIDLDKLRTAFKRLDETRVQSS